MSAFIVPDSHIQAIVNYAVGDRQPIYYGKKRIDLTESGAADRLGQILVDANYASVNSRYGQTDQPYLFRFKRNVRPISHVQMIKALICLDYQSCERDDWTESDAFLIISSLLWRAASRVDGYADAQWVVDR